VKAALPWARNLVFRDGGNTACAMLKADNDHGIREGC
jgi:hypothetical protein